MLNVAVLGVLLAIDPAQSHVTLSVQHVFVERVTGTVALSGGTVDVPSGSLVPANVRAEIDAATLKTGDPDRDAALQSSDWFDTKRFPTWTFASTAIAPAPGGFTLDGVLTMHGVSQPQRLRVTVAGTAAHPVYHASGTIDRHAFGMKINRLDPVIGNPVTVALDIATK